jgi:hypothetical protein
LISGLIAGILAFDDHRRSLIGELRYRSHDIFAVMQATVSQTLGQSHTLSDARRRSRRAWRGSRARMQCWRMGDGRGQLSIGFSPRSWLY